MGYKQTALKIQLRNRSQVKNKVLVRIGLLEEEKIQC